MRGGHDERIVTGEGIGIARDRAQSQIMLELWRFFQDASVNLPNGASACLSVPMGDEEIDRITSVFERFLDKKAQSLAELN